MKYLIAILSAILFAGCGQEPDRPSGIYIVRCQGIEKSYRVRVLMSGRVVSSRDGNKIVEIPENSSCVWEQKEDL